MRLRKVCPQCNTVPHVKRSVCDCRYAFTSKKRKAQCTAVGKLENAMKRKKSLTVWGRVISEERERQSP